MNYFIGILFVISIIIWFFYKEAVFYNKDFQDKYNIKLDIKNDYVKFFFLQNHDPLYVFNKDFINNYSVYAHENNKSNLIYPHQQTIADIDYMSNIQYAASNTETFKVKYLYNELNNITSISPYWSHIYEFWQLLLPASKSYKGDLDKELTWENTIKLWEKWIFFNCDDKKIKNILSLEDEKYMNLAYNKTWAFYKENKNPCSDKNIASNLWFNYFHYIKDLEKTIRYYKIAWFDETALPWIIWMVSVANGMLWEHEKAIYMLIQRAISMYDVLENNKNLDKKQVETYTEQIEISLKRAQEELHFYIIKKAEEKSKECKKDYKCLENNWYIKQEIQTLQNYCIDNVNIGSIKTIKDIIDTNTEKSLETSKCFLLWFWQANNYIWNWQLKSAIIEWWTYYYDEENQRWWVWKIK